MATQVTREGIVILGPSVRQYRQDGRPPVAALTKTVKRSTKGAVQRMQNHHSISKEMGRTPLKAPSAEISSLDHLETRVDKSNSRNMKSVSRPRHAMRSFAVCRRLICSCNRAAVHGQETTERAQAYSNLDSSSSSTSSSALSPYEGYPYSSTSQADDTIADTVVDTVADRIVDMIDTDDTHDDCDTSTDSYTKGEKDAYSEGADSDIVEAYTVADTTDATISIEDDVFNDTMVTTAELIRFVKHVAKEEDIVYQCTPMISSFCGDAMAEARRW